MSMADLEWPVGDVALYGNGYKSNSTVPEIKNKKKKVWLEMALTFGVRS